MAEMTPLEFKIVGNTAEATSSINRLKRSLNGLSPATRSAGRSLQNLGNDARESGDGFKKANSGVVKFLNSVKRILMYRMIRSVLSGITQAIREGINNMYEYSRVAGTEFAGAMNTAKSAMTTWKNSLAAAFAPLIEWVVPYLKQAVIWIVEFNNKIGAFFAALTGKKSYTAAIWYQDQYKESVQATTGAVKELQRYLAPFDELNVLPSNNNGGGGGGSSTPNYSDMFEERELPGWAQSVKDFLDKIKGWISDFWDWLTGLDFVQFLVTGWERIKDLVTEKLGELPQLFPDPVTVDVPTLVTLALSFALSPSKALSAALEYVKKRLGDLNVSVPSLATLVLSFVLNPLAGAAAAGEYIVKELANIRASVPVQVALEPEYEVGSATGASSIEILHQQHGNAVVSTAFQEELAQYLADIQNNAELANAVNQNGEGWKTIGAMAGVAIAGATGVAFIGELPAAIAAAAAAAGTGLGATPVFAVEGEATITSLKDNIPTKDKIIDKVKALFNDSGNASGFKPTANAKALFNDSGNAYGFTPWAYAKALFNDSGNAYGFSPWAYAKAVFNQWAPNGNKGAAFWSNTLWAYGKIWFNDYYHTSGYGAYYKWSTWPWAYGKLWFSAYAFTSNLVSRIRSIFGFATGGVFTNSGVQPITKYAAGGFPGGGQLFIAREAGPELVGSLKGHTAVMNNDQIVASVSAGVARAISNIEFHMDGFATPAYSVQYDGMDYDQIVNAIVDGISRADISNDTYLDGQKIYDSTVEYNRRNTRATGVNAFA